MGDLFEWEIEYPYGIYLVLGFEYGLHVTNNALYLMSLGQI